VCPRRRCDRLPVAGGIDRAWPDHRRQGLRQCIDRLAASHRIDTRWLRLLFVVVLLYGLQMARALGIMTLERSIARLLTIGTAVESSP
jgi:hypothetical protein